MHAASAGEVISEPPFPALLGWTFAAPHSAEPSAVAQDLEWMARLAGGDAGALRPLFDRWKLPLLTYFYRALGSHADAEDLVLQTFTRVYRAAPGFRGDSRFSTWLFAIARGELLHELRRRRRKPVEPVLPEELELALSCNQIGEPERVREAEAELLSALQKLPERERSALLLASSGELSRDEIASTLRVSAGNLAVILHRAREKLRALLLNRDD